MASFNKVIVMGNLTRDPELRQTKGGASVCSASLAINESYIDAQGQRRETPVFVEICAFGKTGENIAKYFFKGSPILVEGRLRQENWKDARTGQQRTKLAILVERFEFVGRKSETGDGARQESRQSPREKSRQGEQRDFIDERSREWNGADELEDDDVPF